MRRTDWFLRVMATLLVIGVWVLILRPVVARRTPGGLAGGPLHMSPEGRTPTERIVVGSDGLRFVTAEGKLLAILSSEAEGARLKLYNERGKRAWAAPLEAETGVPTDRSRLPLREPETPPKPERAEETIQASRIVVPADGLRFVTPQGRRLATVAANQHGGALAVFDRRGHAVMTVAAGEDRTDLVLQQPGGAWAVSMTAYEDFGGRVMVHTKSGRDAVSLSGMRPGVPTGRKEYGGNVTVWHSEGNSIAAEINATASGATLSLRRPGPGQLGSVGFRAGREGGSGKLLGSDGQALWSMPG